MEGRGDIQGNREIQGDRWQREGVSVCHKLTLD